MKALKNDVLDCMTYADAMRGVAKVVELEDLSDRVPHVGVGGASKSSFISTKDSRTKYVLERNSWYGDGYSNEVWLFDRDFTVSEASAFLVSIDAEKKARRAAASWPPHAESGGNV